MTRLANQRRGLVGIVACRGLDGLKRLSSVLGGEVLDLRSLRTDYIRRMFEVAVNEFLVRDIDKRTEEDDGSREEAEAPEGKNLNQVVPEECSDAGL